MSPCINYHHYYYPCFGAFYYCHPYFTIQTCIILHNVTAYTICTQAQVYSNMGIREALSALFISLIMLVSSTDDAILNSLVREKGFAVQDVPRDGNCHQAL